MIIGNPYKFSLFIKVIEDWNAEYSSLHNGVLLFCIDGQLFPKEIVTSTFEVDVTQLIDDLSNIPIHKELLSLEKEKAFIEMYKTTFPKDDDTMNDYRYYISPPILSDNDCIAFAVSDGKLVRVMASKLNYIKEESTYDLNDVDIRDTLITCNEINNIILELDKVFD